MGGVLGKGLCLLFLVSVARNVIYHKFITFAVDLGNHLILLLHVLSCLREAGGASRPISSPAARLTRSAPAPASRLYRVALSVDLRVRSIFPLLSLAPDWNSVGVALVEAVAAGGVLGGLFNRRDVEIHLFDVENWGVLINNDVRVLVGLKVSLDFSRGALGSCAAPPHVNEVFVGWLRLGRYVVVSWEEVLVVGAFLPGAVEVRITFDLL